MREKYPPHNPLQKIKKQTNTTGGKHPPVRWEKTPQRNNLEFLTSGVTYFLKVFIF